VRFECIAPQIAVSLFYSPIVLYVGSEFSPGSWAYQEILAHEMRHLKTYLDHLPKVESVLRPALAIDSGPLPYIKNEMGRVELLQAR
jgi:hypothetical protein